MDIKKIVQNKYSNWEVTPKRRSTNTDAVEASEKTPISFSEVKKKYSSVKATDVTDDAPAEKGIDKKWKPLIISPKDKNTDILMEEKTRFFDESGTEVAAQG